MRFVSSFIALLIIAAKRVWHHRLLMLCLLAGLIVAVGLLSSIPLYADAVHNRLLQGELTEAGTYRPPFSFLWRYVGAWNGEITWGEYAPVDEYLAEQSPAIFGLPSEDQIRHVSTSNLRLFSGREGAFSDDAPLIWAGLGFISGLEQQIQVIEGDFPAGSTAGDAIEVIISQKTADALGLQIGEAYTLFGAGGDGVQLPLRISGVWAPADATNPFWFYKPESFDEILLTTEEAFIDQVVPLLETPVATAVWYQIFDGSKVRPATVSGLLEGVAIIEARVTALLNNTTLDVSPVGALQAYGESSSDLSVVMTVFSLPLIGLVLYFITLIAGMVVRSEQSEIAIMRSRGSTRGQILLIYLMEGLLVGALGLVVGLLFGSWLARLMGQTTTFLDLAMLSRSADPLVTVISTNALQYGVLAVVLVLLALLLPALAASRYTIVTLRWQQARALMRPLWQRYYLDLLLLLLPLYGLYQLNRQGAIALLGASDDPFSNPMLFLVPVLFCFALGLFIMRFFPLVMGALARLAEVIPGTALMMTFRQLARSASLYTGPLLLLCFTVSLAVFTASMALTLDNHLWDRVYYQFGADLNLAELGENTEETQQSSAALGQDQLSSRSTAEDEEEPRWLFLPVNEHLQVPGVEAATRVGDYSATANIGGRQQAGRLLGLDRIDFAAVAFFRPDFAQNEPLGGVLNRLAVDRANVLVSRNFMARNGLITGDPLRLTVGAAGDFADVDFTVAGPLDLFPSVYPQDGPFFVANLDYVHEAMGGAYPYNVWLATDPDVSGEDIVEGVKKIGLSVVSVNNARETILSERGRPERQGLFGLLSAGFLAAAALTVLGFLVYAIVSFQRRFIELGMLRAIGLSISQMGLYLAAEQAALILAGVGLGTILGVLASYLFIPYFQVGATKTDLVPPFIVQIAWPDLVTIYAIFAFMFVLAVAVLIGLLIRMRVFEAVKMGEAV